MPLPPDVDISLDGMAVASAAIIAALFDELVNSGIIPRNNIERIISAARADIGRWSTHGPFGEARAYLNIIQDRLIKSN
jgi:hypothetical protein